MDAAIWMGWTSCASMGCWHSCYQQWHCQKANPEGIKREQRSAADNVTPYLEVLLFFFFLYLFRGLSSPPSYWQWAAGCEHVIIQLMLALVSRDTTGGEITAFHKHVFTFKCHRSQAAAEIMTFVHFEHRMTECGWWWWRGSQQKSDFEGAAQPWEISLLNFFPN